MWGKLAMDRVTPELVKNALGNRRLCKGSFSCFSRVCPLTAIYGHDTAIVYYRACDYAKGFITGFDGGRVNLANRDNNYMFMQGHADGVKVSEQLDYLVVPNTLREDNYV